MKRSLIVAAAILTLSSLFATGCGQSPTSGVPYKSAIKKTTAQTAARTPAGTPAAAAGTLVLQMSSLRAAAAAYQVQATRQDVNALEVKLTGGGLAAPLVRRMTAAELETSNTVAFENVPSGAFHVTLTAFDKANANIGTKSTAIQVQPNQETVVALQLKLNPTVATGAVKFSFDIVDGDEVEAEATPKPTPTASPVIDHDDDADVKALGIEVVGKETVRKLLVLKKLSVTVKVTNHNATETLSGAVKVEYYNTTGLFTKQTKLVETVTQDVKNLAPGKSVELTLVSTKSADDAEATVNTVLSSASASTTDDE